jgi:hypothetical protein
MPWRKEDAMTDGLNRAITHALQVACPECGVLFSARGLAPHRRMRHGTIAVRTTTIEPAPALPSEKVMQTIDFLPQLVRAFDEMLALLRRLEGHVVELERVRQRELANGASSNSNGEAAARALEQALNDVLTRIARIEADARKNTMGGAPNAPEEAQKQLEETTHRQLGKLRKQQARLVFQLRELRGEECGDEALCS